jgi:hypothetical protein
MRLIVDIETNGLLHQLDRIHCVVIRDLDARQVLVFNDQGGTDRPISEAITLMEGADRLIGHNLIGFDIPAIRMIYPWFEPKPHQMMDTMVLSNLKYPDMMRIDAIRKIPDMPKNLWSRHSLEAWGYRLKVAKGSFGKTTDWATWSPEMQSYCAQDTLVTHHLWQHFLRAYPGLT